MRYKYQDHKNRYTMSGVCAEVINDLRKDVQTLKNPQHVSVSGFSRVINLYLKYWFLEVINNRKIFKMHNGFGNLFVIKTLCIRYNPKVVYFVTENGKKVRKTKPMQLKNGMLPFMFWDCGKRWRMYKLTPVKKWKKLIYENFFDKDIDYTEMSLNEYGRKGSDSYVQMIR